MNQSERVKKWRDNTKKRIVPAMGGECAMCGYKTCLRALDLHHIDPSKKEFSFGSIRANAISWSKIVTELRKCVLLCNRCHAEIHDGIVNLPNDLLSFNEKYADYQNLNKIEKQTYCPICGNKKQIAR